MTSVMDARSDQRPSAQTLRDDQRLRGLMVAAQDGDRTAYETLLRACLPRIRAVALRQGADGDLLDDIAQDVLITIHRARQTYDPARPFVVWLTMIVRRRTIDAMRRRWRHTAHEVHSPERYEEQADEHDDAGHIEVRDTFDRVRDALSQLPQAQREAVERLSLKQETLEEASLATGRSLGALKVNLHRGLKALRTFLVDGRGK